MHRILVSDPLKDTGLEMLRASGAEVRALSEDERPQLLDLIGDYDALVVRSMTKVTREVLAAGKNLKVVGRAGIGVDNIDLEAATERGILVVNAPTANQMAATEHTFALLLSMARNVPAANASMAAGEWDRKRFLGFELKGKTLGLIGFGRIGQKVAARAQAFEMDVIAYDPYLDRAVADRLGVGIRELDELMAEVDVLSLHVPLTETTRNIVDARRLALMKEGALLVNCARGGTVDEEALLDALDSGRLAGAALDVFAVEPPTDHRLAQHPRVVVTPHIGAQTREAQERIAVDTAQMVLKALEGSMAVTAVNLPFRSTGSKGEHFLQLGERLGQLASGMGSGGIEAIEVDLLGIAEDLRVPISIAVLKGALSPFLGDTINYVNAETIAESRGIEIRRDDGPAPADYPHLIGVTLVGGGRRVEVKGALFGESDPRVVEFEAYRLEFRPAGVLLALRNRDKPGVVGKVGSLLGEAGVNIVDIHLSRHEDNAAMAVLRLDHPLSDETLRALAAIEEVEQARQLDLR